MRTHKKERPQDCQSSNAFPSQKICIVHLAKGCQVLISSFEFMPGDRATGRQGSN